MTEKFIAVETPISGDWGYADRDLTKTRAQMIAEHRQRAAQTIRLAQQIIDLPDEEFTVVTYRGSFVMNDRKIVTE